MTTNFPSMKTMAEPWCKFFTVLESRLAKVCKLVSEGKISDALCELEKVINIVEFMRLGYCIFCSE